MQAPTCGAAHFLSMAARSSATVNCDNKARPPRAHQHASSAANKRHKSMTSERPRTFTMAAARQRSGCSPPQLAQRTRATDEGGRTLLTHRPKVPQEPAPWAQADLATQRTTLALELEAKACGCAQQRRPWWHAGDAVGALARCTCRSRAASTATRRQRAPPRAAAVGECA